MNNDKLGFAKIIGGELFPYLQDIRLFGRVDDDGDFFIFGCHDDDQGKFYSGILEFDKVTECQGFKTVEDVEKYWTEWADMLLFVDSGDYELLEDKTE